MPLSKGVIDFDQNGLKLFAASAVPETYGIKDEAEHAGHGLQPNLFGFVLTELAQEYFYGINERQIAAI